jgi:single-stranded-DNA-specific exonuclease
VAQRLARRFGVPAVAVCFSGGTCAGSVRSARGYAIGGLLARCADLFIDSGGHQAAGGFSLTEDHWDAFLDRLKETARLIEFPDGSGDDVLEIDAELPPEYLTPDLLNLVDRLSPYGKDNEELLFLARNLVIREINLVGKTETKHLRMAISGGKYQWPAIFWDALSRLEKREFAKGDTVDVVFGLYREWYRGTGNPQMLVKDIRRSDEKKE